jgi:hypothetical protein
MKTCSLITYQQTFGFPITATEFSGQFNFATNQNLILINSEKNPIIKSIEILPYSLSVDRTLEYMDIRMRLLNRDGSVITSNAGEIKNGISGPFQAILKNSDIDIILGTKKTSIDFLNGIVIGGYQLISYSYKFYTGSPTGNGNLGLKINIRYEE